MNNSANPQQGEIETQPEPQLRVIPLDEPGQFLIPSGIGAIDRRTGGLEPGGVFLISGTPGPAKLVAAFQFLRAGLSEGEKVLFLTGMDPADVLEVSGAWGSELNPWWDEGKLGIVGFRDDFEMRVLRSTEPEDALAELDRLVDRDVTRIAVDPGSMFLQGGARSLLGRSFLDWARKHPATVCSTLSIDSAESLPSAAEWLVHATDGVFLIDRMSNGLFQVTLNRSLPGSPGDEDPITLKLSPGLGLVDPDRLPTRRVSDRPVGDPDCILLLSLGDNSTPDLVTWAEGAFKTEIMSQSLEAVARLQGGPGFGCVLVHAPRQNLKEAAQACRAMRPLTSAAIVFASDDSIRSTDRVRLLEAGADDCLSGGVDFRELSTRISQAVAAGGKPAAPPEAVPADSRSLTGGRVSAELFKLEVEERSALPAVSIFALLRLSSSIIPRTELETSLSAEIRGEEGDMVVGTSHGCLALLQGARWDSAQAFLIRLRANLEKRVGRDSALRAEVLAHPADKDEIHSTLASLKDPAPAAVGTTNPGGTGGQVV